MISIQSLFKGLNLPPAFFKAKIKKKKIFFARVKIFKKFFLDFGNTYHRDFFLKGRLSYELYNEKKN